MTVSVGWVEIAVLGSVVLEVPNSSFVFTDPKSTNSEFLTQWDDYQKRLQQVIEEGVERLGFMLRQEARFIGQEREVSCVYENVNELMASKGKRD